MSVGCGWSQRTGPDLCLDLDLSSEDGRLDRLIVSNLQLDRLISGPAVDVSTAGIIYVTTPLSERSAHPCPSLRSTLNVDRITCK